MMDGEQFRNLVGGRRHGLDATLLRFLLGCVECPYALAVACRNRLYDLGVLKSRVMPVPVVSVGNLTLGGTGKSPLVAWLGRYFLEQNLRPGLISRGYGRASAAVNDEFLELAFHLPTVPHLQNPDRIAAARELLEQVKNSRGVVGTEKAATNGSEELLSHFENAPKRGKEEAIDLLILDDAMQHRRIARDLDIVLLDATEPFGFEHVFPRGTLREPLSALRRAHVALLSRADLVTETERRKIKERVFNIAPDIIWGEVAHAPETLVSADRRETGLDALCGKRVLAFCGIGNPGAFHDTLIRCGADIAGRVSFPDHYRYTSNDLERIHDEAEKLGVDGLVCTMKDLVKIDANEFPGTIPLQALTIKIRFLDGEAAFRDRLGPAVQAAQASARRHNPLPLVADPYKRNDE